MHRVKINMTNQSIIDYFHEYQFLGSCFSENLYKKMQQAGFKVKSNPFGVIFNPVSIADFLLLNDKELKKTVFMREDVALSWMANSTCFDYDAEKLKDKLVSLRKSFMEDLVTTKVLFITFGTAYVYEDIHSKKIVANCHKVPQNKFSKRLLSITEIVNQWEKVIRKLDIFSNMYGTELKIVFTVSPVRHIKDGVIENARSKATLLTAIHELKDKFSEVDYFPSYEIMLDVLRDYSYYKSDKIHPNGKAIDEIWETFQETYFSVETQSIYKEYEELKRFVSHQPLHPESKKSKELMEKKEVKIQEFKGKFPAVSLDFLYLPTTNFR